MEGASASFDRYEILAPLGAGGMGEVVKARAVGPHGFEKIVAIKRIRAEWAAEEAMAERFIREARIAARLQHANIVQVFDFGRHADELFLVMEHVEGQSLDQILATIARDGKRPTLAQTLQVGLDVSRALDCAHNLKDEDGAPVGVIHRDVSPANVLVSRQGIVKLTDFGIAAWASNQGRTSLVAGKPLYMAPEQLRGEALDARADLFAVGVLLYEMLTGERPWKGIVDASPDATLEAMGYRAPSTLTTGTPLEVDALLERLLQPAASARLASARELTKEIVGLSYRCQIVLDPMEVAPLVSEEGGEAHAPTLPRYVSKIQTLVAAGVSADGATVLETGDERGSVSPVRSTRPPRRLPAWVWIAAALVLIAGGVAAALATSEPPLASTASERTEVRVETSASRVEESEPSADRAETIASHDRADVAEPSQPSATLSGAVDGARAADPVPVTPADAGAREAAEPRAQKSGARAPARRPAHDATEPARPAPDGASGELDVFSRPWAEIFIDGERQSQNAPARGLQVAAGRHRVRLVNPVLGLSAERTVDVPEGGRAQLRVFLDAAEGEE